MKLSQKVQHHVFFWDTMYKMTVDDLTSRVEVCLYVVDTWVYWQVCSHIYVFRAKYAQQQVERCEAGMEPESVRVQWISRLV